MKLAYNKISIVCDFICFAVVVIQCLQCRTQDPTDPILWTNSVKLWVIEWSPGRFRPEHNHEEPANNPGTNSLHAADYDMSQSRAISYITHCDKNTYCMSNISMVLFNFDTEYIIKGLYSNWILIFWKYTKSLSLFHF